MIPMFEGVNNSPEAILSANISATATTIALNTISGLPPAPNIATIGKDDDAEVVYYGGMSGTSLINVTRGFGGTAAKEWLAGETVARCYTKYDHDTFIANIQELQKSVKRYGVKFSGSVAAGTRLYDAVGLSAAVGTDTETAENDFDNIMPWAAMRRCNTALVDGVRVPTFFEGEAGYSSTEADVFVYVPLFYYYRSADDSEHVVSMSPLAGYRAPAKFKNANGTLRDYVFLPAYTAGLVKGAPVSRSGYYPVLPSLNSIMNLCSAAHTAAVLDSDIWIEGMKDDEIRNILLDVEFATRDHQTFMHGAASMRYSSDTATEGGTNQFTLAAATAAYYCVGQAIAIGTSAQGQDITTNATITAIDTETGVITFESASGADVIVSEGNYISSRPWKSGACDGVRASSGSPVSNTSGRYPCKYRGIENPWGNQFRWRWDFLKNDDQPYVLDDPNNYDATINAHYAALSYTVPTANAYATKMGFDENYPYARATEEASGGSSTTYFADYYYYSAGLRALLVGGYVYNGRDAGARYCYVNYSPSSSNWSIGAALSPA